MAGPLVIGNGRMVNMADGAVPIDGLIYDREGSVFSV
jgi:hypothetical protein